MSQNKLSNGAAFLLCVVENETQYFIWHNGNMVYEFTNTDSNAYVFFHRLIGSDDYLYCTNAHGDVVKLVNSNGIVVKTYDYDAFGNETGLSENDTNPYRYAGEYFDKETGTIYLRARYYNPTVGRFSTVDPIRDGLNWYAYCGNSPVAFVDPSGLELVLVGDENLHNVSLGYLQELTNHKLSIEDDRVVISEYSDDTSLSAGNTLIERIITSDNICELNVGYSGGNYMDYVEIIFTNSSPMYLKRCIVNIDLTTFDNGVATITNNVFNQLESVQRPLYIAFAHELIHVDREFRGVVTFGNVLQAHFVYNGKQVEMKMYETVIDELLTIGIYVKGYQLDEIDITENDIRMEHGLLLRGAHLSA